MNRFARTAARWSATTVLPVPADPRTRAGPLKRRSTRARWSGWRKIIQSSIGAAIRRRSSCGDNSDDRPASAPRSTMASRNRLCLDSSSVSPAKRSREPFVGRHLGTLDDPVQLLVGDRRPHFQERVLSCPTQPIDFVLAEPRSGELAGRPVLDYRRLVVVWRLSRLGNAVRRGITRIRWRRSDADQSRMAVDGYDERPALCQVADLVVVTCPKEYPGRTVADEQYAQFLPAPRAPESSGNRNSGAAPPAPTRDPATLIKNDTSTPQASRL